MRFKTDWASLIIGSKFTVFALFYFVFEGNFPSTSPRGACILFPLRGDLTDLTKIKKSQEEKRIPLLLVRVRRNSLKFFYCLSFMQSVTLFYFLQFLIFQFSIFKLSYSQNTRPPKN